MAIKKVRTESHEDWLNLRKCYLGGSDAAAVVGLNRFSSPYALWAEKCGKVPGFSGNLATEVGTYLEEFVARKFAEETGKKVRRVNQSFLNSDYPFAIANIDREIVGEDAGLEIKTTSELNMKQFAGGEYPDNYYCQCVHYMAVTGKKRWYLAVLIGNRDFKTFVIDRDESEIAALMDAEKEFWEHVKNNTPPTVDGMQATTSAIKAIFPDSNESVVDLYGHIANLDRYISLGKQIDELEEAQDECANSIKEYMGEAGAGECEKYKVSWKSSTRRTFDSKRFAKENPQIDLSEYFKESNSRAFKVAILK